MGRRGSQTGICSSGDAHGSGGVSAQVLVWEEENAFAAGKGPFEDGAGVRAGADDASVAAAEGLQVGGGVDVGDGHEVVGVDDRAEVGPGGFDGVEVGHVGHAATGGHVGQDDVDFGAGEDVGGFGHEVDAAEDDGPAGCAFGGHFRQFVAVTPEVGELDDLVLLVVVAQDQERVAECVLGGKDAFFEPGLVFVAERFEGQGACLDLLLEGDTHREVFLVEIAGFADG